MQIEIPELLMRTRADLTIESAGQAIPTYEHADLLLWILEYQPATRWSEIKVIMDKLEHQNDLESAASHSTTGTAGIYIRSCKCGITHRVVHVRPLNPRWLYLHNGN